MPATIELPATSTPTIVRPRVDEPGNGFMAQVVVRNDDTFPVEVVLAAFYKVLPGMTPDRIVELVCQIEDDGLATVFTGTREVCELYAEQLNGYGLDAYVA